MTDPADPVAAVRVPPADFLQQLGDLLEQASELALIKDLLSDRSEAGTYAKVEALLTAVAPAGVPEPPTCASPFVPGIIGRVNCEIPAGHYGPHAAFTAGCKVEWPNPDTPIPLTEETT